jgi:hypothetical protein
MSVLQRRSTYISEELKTMKLLPFCEPGDEYTVPWVGGGFSRCFLQIVGSMSTAGLLYLLGLLAIVLAPKPKKEVKAGEGKEF